MRPTLALVIPLLLVLGCAGRRPPPSQAPVVKKIHFEGNGGGLTGTGDYTLRGAIEQEQNPPLSFLAPRRRKVPLDRETLAVDGWRLETWYAHHGYFDARFLGWDVVTVRKGTKRRPPTVRLIGYVDQGPESTVSSVVWEGVEEQPGPLTRLLERTSEPGEGDRFDLEALRATEDSALARLQDSSFAKAEIVPSVTAHPEEERVDIRFDVAPGPACRIGEVTIDGEITVPERLLRPELTFEQGESYKGSELEATRRRLYGLGVFSTVEVEPLLEPGGGVPEDVVPVRIRLGQAKAQQLRLGGGFSFESGKQEAHVLGEYKHVNLFNRLLRLQLSNTVGYTALATVGELTEEGLFETEIRTAPTVDASLNLRIPRFPARPLAVELDVDFELGIEQAYRYASPSVGPSLHWRLSRKVTAIFGYGLTYFDYLPGDVELDNDTLLGLDGTDPYFLSMLSQQLIVDRRNDLIMPRRGSYAVFSVDEAGGPLGGGYNFVRVQADQRVYIPVVQIFGLVPRATLALRGAAGAITTYGRGSEARVPYAERLYQGGSTTVRGWTRYHLGPYSFPCEEDGESDTCYSDPDERQPTSDVTPIGGLLSGLTSAELRAYPWEPYGFAVFSDAGMAWGTWTDLTRIPLLPSVGAGFRYKSPIGPVRLDLAMRLDQRPMFAEEPRFNLHFSLSEAF